MASKDDPRDASLAVRNTLPTTWRTESTEAFTTSAMMLSGMIMMTRNRYLAWPAVIFGINALINAHPARLKEGGGHYSAFFLSLSALMAAYLPLVVIGKAPAPIPA